MASPELEGEWEKELRAHPFKPEGLEALRLHQHDKAASRRQGGGIPAPFGGSPVDQPGFFICPSSVQREVGQRPRQEVSALFLPPLSPTLT